MKVTCRTCAESTYSRICLNIFHKEQSNLLMQIQEITDIRLEKSQDLPQHMCRKCQRELKQAIVFRNTCITSQRILLLKQSNDGTAQMDPLGAIEYETQIKQERTLEAVKKKHEDNTQNTQNIKEEIIEYCNDSNDYIDYEVSTNDNTNDYEERDEVYDIYKVVTTNQQNEVFTTTVKEDKEECKNVADQQMETELTEITTKIFSEDASQKKAKSKEISICEHCGKSFTSSSNFRLHLVQHTGIKNFQCEFCLNKYWSKELLRRHQRVHTNEMPFSCKYCHKLFRSSSNKVKHERKHTNERPFHCQYCVKSFQTSTYLKNHELVHTGIRKYHCEICEQSFLRPEHLKVHYRSKIHQLKAKNIDLYAS